MTGRRRFGDDERRARLGLRHHLGRPAPSIESAAGDLVGLHSSDPATVVLSARARRPEASVEELEHALYQARTLVRLLGMRRTMFVVPRDLAGVIDASCGRELGRAERKRLLAMIESSGAAGRRRPDRWLAAVEDRTVAALAEHGPAAAAELKDHVPELGLKLTAAEGTKWAAEVGVSSRVLGLLAMDGRIVRSRPRGSWLSSQYRWARTEDWLGEPFAAPAPEAARSDLLRRWLWSFGPAPVSDLKWWTGWTLGATRAALAAVDAVSVDLPDGEGWALADDLEPVGAPAPWVALLPSLDPTPMGWKERSWYLRPEHVSALFDNSGNIGPTVWVDGRIVGGWGQGPDGTVAYRLLADVGSEAQVSIAAEAAALTDWLGGVVVTPRFPTPIDKELRSGV
ncbi:MAG TPA: winged helix DNA-binding domain-containing protein [Acidimicrobiales bacterium]